MAWTKHDWNGDGKVDKWDDLYELAAQKHLEEEAYYRPSRSQSIREELEFQLLMNALDSDDSE